MFVALLAILSFAGGCTVVYFVMDSPRKKAAILLDELKEENEDIKEYEDRLNHISHQLDRQQQALDSSTNNLNSQIKAFESDRRNFEKNVITYQDLEKENRILKADIKAAVLHAAYQDSVKAQTDQMQSSVVETRNKLGRELLFEVNASIRKTLSIANYPSLKQKLMMTYAKVRSFGINVSSEEEEKD